MRCQPYGGARPLCKTVSQDLRSLLAIELMAPAMRALGRSRRQRLLGLLAALVTLCALGASASSAATIQEFPLPGPGRGIALGPDGNLWVSIGNYPRGVARVLPTGT